MKLGTEKYYAIGVLNTKDYEGNLIPKEEQEYMIAGINEFFGTPCWVRNKGIVFDSIEDAKKFFKDNKKYLDIEENDKYVDVSTLCIIEITETSKVNKMVVMKTPEEIELEKKERAEYERLKAKFEP